MSDRSSHYRLKMSYDAPDLTPFKKSKFKSLQPLYKIENLLNEQPSKKKRINGIFRQSKYGSTRHPPNKHQLSNCTTTIKLSKSKRHQKSSIISIEDEKQVFYLSLFYCQNVTTQKNCQVAANISNQISRCINLCTGFKDLRLRKRHASTSNLFNNKKSVSKDKLQKSAVFDSEDPVKTVHGSNRFRLGVGRKSDSYLPSLKEKSSTRSKTRKISNETSQMYYKNNKTHGHSFLRNLSRRHHKNHMRTTSLLSDLYSEKKGNYMVLKLPNGVVPRKQNFNDFYEINKVSKELCEGRKTVIHIFKLRKNISMALLLSGCRRQNLYFLKRLKSENTMLYQVKKSQRPLKAT